MKKTFLVVLALLVVFSVSAFAQFNVKVGMDFSGEFTFEAESVSISADIKNGFTIAGEYVVPYSDEIDFGIGLAYQFARSFDEVGANEDETFSFVPIYGVAKYNIEQFYVLGQLGYNMFNASEEFTGDLKTEGGLYYGVGGGIKIAENIFAEILYSANNGKLTDDVDEIKVNNSQISAMVGFSF